MEHYYLRVRGQVTGPFSVGQLQDLRLRGQLGRFHEVSVDQVRWAPAGSLSALFPSGAMLATAEAAPAPTPLLQPTAEWYYLDRANQQRGPASLQDLQALLDAGDLDPGSFACKQGMAEWATLASLPQLNMPSGGAGWGTVAASTGGGTYRTVLLIGVVLAPLLGLSGAALSVYLALESFAAGDAGLGVVYLVLLLLVAGLAGAGMYWLVGEYRKPQ
jgi:hypothetical protein